MDQPLSSNRCGFSFITAIQSKILASSTQVDIWIYLENPLSFLDETRHAFILEWRVNISIPSVWRIMAEYKLTYKVREIGSICLSLKYVHISEYRASSNPDQPQRHNSIFQRAESNWLDPCDVDVSRWSFVRQSRYAPPPWLCSEGSQFCFSVP